MIPRKRTLSLGWALVTVLVSTGALADEHAADAASDVALEQPTNVQPTSDAEAPTEVAPSAELATEAAEAGSVETDTNDEVASSDAVPAALDPMPSGGVVEALAAEEAIAPAGVGLGELGYDSEGNPGRIHVVALGDTLWDISESYLGTPWVWPSIWSDNGEIANPHLIHPGNQIWITPTEMRRITPEEAEQMLANAPTEEAPADLLLDAPAAPDLELPIAPETPAFVPEESRTVTVSAREASGLISSEEMKSAASVVAKVPERVMMSQEDLVYIGLGEAEVEVGDEFTIFRTNQKVYDPDTGDLLGYHVDLLGWVKVVETAPESSLASIRMSIGEIELGDKIIPREPLPPEIPVAMTPDGVEGRISFFPQQRVLMGFADFVYLNRGTLDGLEVGSPLEVYRQGYPALERSREELVEVPDRVIAKMLVVRAEDESSVAVVTSAERELELGDHFRGEGQ